MTSPPTAPARYRPWRSATTGWIVTGLTLIGGVPLFLCMPPWNDVTLHDLAARSIIRGGVHYRDVFDTNLPGIDWAMAGIRLLFGWSYEALRAVDLVVIGVEVVLLLGWVRWGGGTSATLAWLAAAIALFYPFCSEFNHVQRDPWLLLPALAGARLRLSRVLRAAPPPSGSILEGLAWGVAVWVKPHVVIPAFALWLTSVGLMLRRETRRAVLIDLAGLMVGGLLAGAAGVTWMVRTGAWPYFLDVFLNWNPGYLADVWGSTSFRFVRTFWCFRPWSLLHFAALPLAILALWDAKVWSRRPLDLTKPKKETWFCAPCDSEAIVNARALLAAFYLAWFAQATLLQKGLDYVQVPLLFLAMAVVATHRWGFGFAYLIWFLVVGVVFRVPVLAQVPLSIPAELPVLQVEPHPLTDPHVMKLWPRCWREGGSPELRDKIGQFTDVHCGTNWEELEDVARFLKTVNPPLGPGELNCWHDSTHPLYLMLDLEPATRYAHYGTALGIRKKVDQIAAEVAACPQRYVVSDLMRMTWYKKVAYEPGAGGNPLRLPAWFPLSQRSAFPWNQPIVFRSGRYLLHKVENPLGLIDVPEWDTLDKLGPGEK